MRDKLQDIENSMLSPIHREIADLVPFSKMNYFKRGATCMKNRYPKTRRTRTHVKSVNCPGKIFRDRKLRELQLAGKDGGTA